MRETLQKRIPVTLRNRILETSRDHTKLPIRENTFRNMKVTSRSHTPEHSKHPIHQRIFRILLMPMMMVSVRHMLQTMLQLNNTKVRLNKTLNVPTYVELYNIVSYQVGNYAGEAYLEDYSAVYNEQIYSGDFTQDYVEENYASERFIAYDGRDYTAEYSSQYEGAPFTELYISQYDGIVYEGDYLREYSGATFEDTYTSEYISEVQYGLRGELDPTPTLIETYTLYVRVA